MLVGRRTFQSSIPSCRGKEHRSWAISSFEVGEAGQAEGGGCVLQVRGLQAALLKNGWGVDGTIGGQGDDGWNSVERERGRNSEWQRGEGRGRGEETEKKIGRKRKNESEPGQWGGWVDGWKVSTLCLLS